MITQQVLCMYTTKFEKSDYAMKYLSTNCRILHGINIEDALKIKSSYDKFNSTDSNAGMLTTFKVVGKFSNTICCLCANSYDFNDEICRSTEVASGGGRR